MPDISFFRWYMQNENNLKTFLMDLSSRRSDTLSQETELTNQLNKVSQGESLCISELDGDIISLLEEEQSKITTSITDCKVKISKAREILLLSSVRKDTLIRRGKVCQQYIDNL
ncbi:hypothetical protein LLG10_02910 [bacterium]|nr:hypothetical protein [bacterium]